MTLYTHSSGWTNINFNSPGDIRDASIQLHHACQFLAIIGKHLIPQKDDDSNTNIGIIAGGLIGRKVNGQKPFHGFIDLPGFTLNLIDPEMSRIWSTEIEGKTRNELLNELQVAIQDLGHDGRQLKHIDHYKLEEDHPLQHNEAFTKPDAHSLNTWHSLYSNARIILRKVAHSFDNSEDVRIWPHHFDIGSYILLNKEGTRAIGIGLAIPDSVVDDFYFYIYGWQKNVEIDMSEFTPLTSGIWKKDNWKGAILPVSELILSQNDQGEMVSSFFSQTTDQYRKVLQ